MSVMVVRDHIGFLNPRTLSIFTSFMSLKVQNCEFLEFTLLSESAMIQGSVRSIFIHYTFHLVLGLDIYIYSLSIVLSVYITFALP